MKTMILEIRDRATFIPVIAINLGGSANEAEAYYLRRLGYRPGTPAVLLTKIVGGVAHVDPHYWADKTTFRTAHQYIVDHWDELADGSVIDAEHIRGESEEPKTSERFIKL